MIKYYLRKESFAHTIEEIVKANGEVIPKREVISGDRAIYRVTGLPSRRFRSSYPVPCDKDLRLYTCKTLNHIMKERQYLFDYCSEWFDVYDDNGKVDIGIQ